jgi:hypothetical protein
MRVLAMSALVCALVPGLSATAEAQSLKKLQRCLEFKDMTKPRLDCYDAIVSPRTKPKSGPAGVVNDCRFLKDDNERLICFNRFVENPPKPVMPESSAKPLAPKNPTEPAVVLEKPVQPVAPKNSAPPVAPEGNSAAPKSIEPKPANWWEWVVSRFLAR